MAVKAPGIVTLVGVDHGRGLGRYRGCTAGGPERRRNELPTE